MCDNCFNCKKPKILVDKGEAILLDWELLDAVAKDAAGVREGTIWTQQLVDKYAGILKTLLTVLDNAGFAILNRGRLQ